MAISLRNRKFSVLYVLVNRCFALLLFLLFGALGRADASITLVQHTSRDAGSTTTSSLSFVVRTPLEIGLPFVFEVVVRPRRYSPWQIPTATRTTRHSSLASPPVDTALPFFTPRTSRAVRTQSQYQIRLRVRCVSPSCRIQVWRHRTL